MLEEAFDDLTDADWAHALGGRHFLVEEGGGIVAHASVVERVLWVGTLSMRAGYVEAVATHPLHQGLGLGTTVMRAAGDHITSRYDLGALSTGATGFYERLGWRVWTGTTGTGAAASPTPTPWEDGGVMILPTRWTPSLPRGAMLVCDRRDGDAW